MEFCEGRKKTITATRSVERSHALSRTELYGTQNDDLLLIDANETGNSQREFNTVPLRDFTSNSDSLPRRHTRQKVILDLEYYNSLKKSLPDQKMRNNFL